MSTESPPAVRLYVVRHAEAGVRTDSPDDHLRALTTEGRARARVVAGLLADLAVGEIVSSPFTRCVETVEPLAARRRRTIVLSDVLAEGVEIATVLHLLRSLPDGSVLCAHGDTLTGLVPELRDARERTDTPLLFDKGVVWVLSRQNLALSLVDEIGPSDGPVGRDVRKPQGCATASAPAHPHDRRSIPRG